MRTGSQPAVPDTIVVSRHDERIRVDRISWDEFAERYDRQFLEDPLYRDCLRLIVEQVEASDAHIMDLGCGTGGVTGQLLRKLPEAVITGVDPSSGMREVYAQRFEADPRIEVIEGSAVEIPAPDAAFDYVVSNLALHHVTHEHREACAREIARVLKPGGKLVYCDHFLDVEGPTRDKARCRDAIEKTVGWALYSLEAGAYDHALGLLRVLPLVVTENGEYLTTVEEWSRLLAQAGMGDFRIVEVPPTECGMKIVCAARA
jgi:ubiquinone/menaquinone biosynthesis C-methylase UbiE